MKSSSNFFSFGGVFFLFMFLNTQGQTVFVSPLSIDENNFDNLKVIGQDDDGFFILESNLPFELEKDHVGFKNRKYKIAYFNNALSPQWTKSVEAMPEDATIQSIIFSQQKILIVCALDNKIQNKRSLYGQWMNNKGEIVMNKEIGVLNFENKSDLEKARLITSANQQFSGVVVCEFTNDQRQIIHYLLVDSSLRLIYNKSLLINYSDKNFITTEYSVSNKGDFHLLGVRTIKDRKAERKKQEDFVIFSNPADSSNFSEFLLIDNEKEVTNASINFDNINNKIVCAGFYSERSSSIGAGIIYATIEMNNPLQLNIKSNPIENKTHFKLMGERNRESDIGLTDYPIAKIILRSDGGAVIVAEAAYTSDYSYYDYFTQSYTRRTEFHYNNIAVVSVNSNGTIAWLDIIRKDQESEDDGGAFSSFCPILTPDELIFIYNSDISRSTEMLAVRISNAGTQTENHLSRASDHLLLFSKNGKQISENEVVLPCISKKKLTLVKITF